MTMWSGIIKKDDYFSFLSLHFVIYFCYPIGENIPGHRRFSIIHRKIGRVFKSKFLKHRGRVAFPITRGLSFSPPILHATITVIRSFASFPPLHSKPFSAKLLSGSAREKKTGFVTIKHVLGFIVFNFSFRVSFYFSISRMLTSALSPEILKWPILNGDLKLASQPVDALKSKKSNCLANSNAFSCKIGPLIGKFLDLACSNHLNNASFNEEYFHPLLNRFRFLPPIPLNWVR